MNITSNSWTAYRNIHILTTVAKKTCCFCFPKPPATKTLISQPPLNLDDNDKIMQNAKSLLQTVQNTLTTASVHNKSTQQFLQDINLDFETYMDALQISQRGPNVILK